MGHGYSRIKHGFRLVGSGIFRAFLLNRAQSAESLLIRAFLFPQLAQQYECRVYLKTVVR
jgi:hypothetical protein